MKLNVDLSALLNAVKPLNFKSDFSFNTQLTTIPSISKEFKEKDIKLIETNSGGVLTYEGQQILLYIPDQGYYMDDVLVEPKGKNGKRIHLSECKTIQQMREKGRFNTRYKAENRLDGLFPSFGISEQNKEEINAELSLAVCQNCLMELNYYNFTSMSWPQKQQLIQNFSFLTFFETYSSYFDGLPQSIDSMQTVSYTSDWASISSKKRGDCNYICQYCGVNLQQYHYLLHTHHINGNKSDNSDKNLRVLCVDCHKKQPHHGHMYVSHTEVQLINQVRREQRKPTPYSYDEIEYCVDTALTGLVQKCKANNLVAGEVGMVQKINNIEIPIDLCWPRRKVAVLIDCANAQLLCNKGWEVFTAAEALRDFVRFQAIVR